VAEAGTVRLRLARPMAVDLDAARRLLDAPDGLGAPLLS
jgi:hypothetical protein